MADKYGDSPAAIVVGGGPAGLTAAITLAAGGVPTTLAGRRPAKNPTTPDNRTTALLAGSITALETLGVWDLCGAYAAPLKIMRIVDDTGRLWRAPEVKFEASEIKLDAFGYNIENRYLVDALEQRARALPELRLIDDEVIDVAPGENAVTVTLKSGHTLQAPLIIGADGRRSACRDAARIDIAERVYPQVALTVCLRHSRTHNNTSTEFHTSTGPFTLVPLPGRRSSLVWVLDPATQTASLHLMTMNWPMRLSGRPIRFLENRGRARTRTVSASERKGKDFAAERIALVGEAAHVIPPIGAQGSQSGSA